MQELANASQDIIDWLSQSAQDATAFMTEQAPLYAQEYLDWTFYNNLFQVISWSFLFVCVCVWNPLSWKIAKKAQWEDPDPKNLGLIASWLISFVVTLATIIVIPGGIATMIKVKVAPKVVIVEHLQDLL